jgi:hypothetical protein
MAKRKGSKMVNPNLNPSQSLLFSDSKDTKITAFLKAMPSLDFSDNGLKNIAKRFNTTIEFTQRLIDSLKRENYGK